MRKSWRPLLSTASEWVWALSHPRSVVEGFRFVLKVLEAQEQERQNPTPPSSDPLEPEVRLRTREGLLSAVELAASKEKQLEYKRTVPIANVTAELFEQWDDYFLSVRGRLNQLFSAAEASAIIEYDRTLNEVSAKLEPGRFYPIEEFVKTEEWKQLNLAAGRALCELDVESTQG